MGARFKTVAYTLVGSPIQLADILNSAGDTYISSMTLRAGKTNSGDVTWVDTGSAGIGGYLEPREAASFDLAGKFIKTSDILISGESGDIVYITVIG